MRIIVGREGDTGCNAIGSAGADRFLPTYAPSFTGAMDRLYADAVAGRVPMIRQGQMGSLAAPVAGFRFGRNGLERGIVAAPFALHDGADWNRGGLQ